MYGTPITLKIDGDEQLKSILGGLCSLLTMLIILAAVIFFCFEAKAKFGDNKVIWNIQDYKVSHLREQPVSPHKNPNFIEGIGLGNG